MITAEILVIFGRFRRDFNRLRYTTKEFFSSFPPIMTIRQGSMRKSIMKSLYAILFLALLISCGDDEVSSSHQYRDFIEHQGVTLKLQQAFWK